MYDGLTNGRIWDLDPEPDTTDEEEQEPTDCNECQLFKDGDCDGYDYEYCEYFEPIKQQ